MKVALVGPAYPYRGGIAHFTSMLAKEFEKSHDVRIVNFSRLYPSFLFPGKTQYDDSDSPLRVDSDRIIDSMNPLSFFRAGKRLAEFDPDLVVFQWWQPFFGPALRVISGSIKRRTGARVVFLCHNVLPHESSVFDRILIKIGLGRADAFVVQSNEDGDNLKGLVPGAVVGFNPHPIYDWFNMNRVSREEARRKLDVDGRVLLFFGLVRAYKGLGVLLEAFAECGEDLDASLLVVGEFYEDRRPYDELIQKLGIGGRVRVIDRYVPNEDVEMYFRAADLVVLPYLSATQSGIVQTAFSFNKPVVVTRVGGLPDVVRDGVTGYVVPPSDPGALASAVRRFFDDRSGEEMAHNIEADADRFSWRRCVDTLISVAGAGRDGGENL